MDDTAAGVMHVRLKPCISWIFFLTTESTDYNENYFHLLYILGVDFDWYFDDDLDGDQGADYDEDSRTSVFVWFHSVITKVISVQSNV